MRITHLVWAMPRGGLESMLVDIANEQCRHHDVQIIVVNNEFNSDLLSELNAKIAVHLVRRPKGSGNPWYMAKAMYAANTFDPDVVHTHQLSLSAFVRLLKIPKITTVHDTVFEPARRISDYVDVCCISSSVRDKVLEQYPNVQTRIIPNGIKFEKIKVRTTHAGPMVRVVQVSRLDHLKKGQDIALHALAQVIRTQREEVMTLDFIGDGPSREYLARLTLELEIQQHVRFLGEKSRDEIYRTLADYDLLIQPSRYEGFGLTIIEAMGAGIPVLVPNLEGPLEIVEGGRYGDTFRCGDADDLAHRITQIIVERHTVRFLERLTAARQMAIARYDIANTAAAYVNAYVAAETANN